MEPRSSEKKERNTGIDVSLAVLRQELESMQKQDKELYKQLRTLQDHIRDLKVELKRERDECEQAFRDLQEISLDDQLPENRRNVSTKGQQTEIKVAEKQANEKEINRQTRSGKHDRQDSGISVKYFGGEISAEFNDIPSKPMIIHHSKQDSGIIIDEETMSETKLLSRLVQSSSRMFSKGENYEVQLLSSRCQQVDEYGPPVYHHKRSRSSNDFHQEKMHSFRDFNSTSQSSAKHSRTRSCPSTSMKTVNQDFHNYKMTATHQFRPKKRSASVVDLSGLREAEDRNVTTRRSSKAGNGSHLATSDPQLFQPTEKHEPLRAVLVSAGEVNVSNSRTERNILVSRQHSVDERMRTSKTAATLPQRRFTVVGLKQTEKQFHDCKYIGQVSNGGKDSRILSSHFPRNHARHRTMPEKYMRRRHSMHTWHASSKSWDGNMERPRHINNLLRSSSQVSLV